MAQSVSKERSKGGSPMAVVDVSRIAQLSTLGVLAAKGRGALARYRSTYSLDDRQRAALEMARARLRSAMSGCEEVSGHPSPAGTLLAVRDYNTIHDAWENGAQPPHWTIENAQRQLERLLRALDALLAEKAPTTTPEEGEVDNLARFFEMLGEYVHETQHAILQSAQ